jgi:hypothetical protein
MWHSQLRAMHVKPEKVLCLRLATCFNHMIVETGERKYSD